MHGEYAPDEKPNEYVVFCFIFIFKKVCQKSY